LNWKDEDTFKTAFGGVMTILSVMCIIVYFSIMLATAIKQEKYSITSSSRFIDLYNDNTNYPLNSDNFDYGLQLAFFSSET